MATESPMAGEPATSMRERTVSVSAYVERPLAEVLARFTAADIDDILSAALQAAHDGTDVIDLRAHAATPAWQSACTARVPITWSSAGPTEVKDGGATLSLLMVQSGHDAITELLLAFALPDEQVPSATRFVHRVLDDLVGRLEASAT
jgi:hypothetical protein